MPPFPVTAPSCSRHQWMSASQALALGLGIILLSGHLPVVASAQPSGRVTMIPVTEEAAQPVTPPVAVAMPDNGQPMIAAFAGDGTVFVVIPGTADTAARRIRVTPEGDTAWSVELPPEFKSPRAAAICGEDALCIAAAPEVTDAANGSLLARFDGTQPAARWQHAVAGDPNANLRWIDSRLMTTDPGDLVLIDDYGGVNVGPLAIDRHVAHRITRAGRDGSIIFSQDTFAPVFGNQPAVQIAAGADGSLAFLTSDTTRRLFTLLPDGRQRVLRRDAEHPTRANALGWALSLGTVFDDGRVGYARYRVTGGFTGWSGGNIHWRTIPIAGNPTDIPLSPGWQQGPGAPMLPIQRVHALEDGDALVLLHLSANEGRGRGVTELYRIDRLGTVRWQRVWEPEGGRDIQWSIDAAGNTALSTVRDSGIWIVRLVSADGELLRHQEIDCGGETCRIDAVALDDTGALTAVGRRHQPDTGPMYQVIRLPAMLPVSTPEPIAARRRDGAWYSPGTDGQGLTLRLLPQADGRITVFMPWFTFRRYDGDTTPQDWILLQGDIAADQRQAQLSIFSSGSGDFPGPGYDLNLIGSATLTMSGCDRALLSYRFDDGWLPRRMGTVALQPLLTALADCPSGSNTAPYGTELANALSGLWFEPDRDGHGIDLHYLPSSSGAGDVLFGAWYTYPAQPEEAERRWFTLQSPQQEADIVRAVIYDTQDGSFDNRPTSNHVRVGEVELVSIACDRLQLGYRFDDQPQAGNYRGRSGQLALHRISECVEWPTTSGDNQHQAPPAPPANSRGPAKGR